jgi:hypothetical protein
MKYIRLFVLAGMALLGTFASSQNPVIRDQFSADPTARVFNGKVFLFPSHDIPAPEFSPQGLVLHGRLPCLFIVRPDRLD